MVTLAEDLYLLACDEVTRRPRIPAAHLHSLPHRVVIFIRVVGCGTLPSMPIRQNNRQPIESVTSAHSDS